MSARVVEVGGGADLGAALAEHEGAWVQGVGTVADAEVAVAGEGTARTQLLSGPATLVSLAGPGAGPHGVVVARSAAEGTTVVAGLLVRARAIDVTLSVQAMEGAAARAAVATGPAPPDGDDESDELPEYNDRVLHPVFGLCDVMVVRGERLKIRDVDGTHRLREIHLGVMKVLRPEEQDGRRVFRLVKRA